ncbi:hypothetical protein ABQE93_00005, partial [Mycolicibacterium sp. XJ662]
SAMNIFDHQTVPIRWSEAAHRLAGELIRRAEEPRLGDSRGIAAALVGEAVCKRSSAYGIAAELREITSQVGILSRKGVLHRLLGR